MADTKQTKDFREIVYSDLDKLIQLQAFSNQETNSKELLNILQDHDTRRKDWFKDHRMSPQFNNIGNIQNKELFKQSHSYLTQNDTIGNNSQWAQQKRMLLQQIMIRDRYLQEKEAHEAKALYYEEQAKTTKKSSDKKMADKERAKVNELQTYINEAYDKFKSTVQLGITEQQITENNKYSVTPPNIYVVGDQIIETQKLNPSYSQLIDDLASEVQGNVTAKQSRLLLQGIFESQSKPDSAQADKTPVLLMQSTNGKTRLLKLELIQSENANKEMRLKITPFEQDKETASLYQVSNAEELTLKTDSLDNLNQSDIVKLKRALNIELRNFIEMTGEKNSAINGIISETTYDKLFADMVIDNDDKTQNEEASEKNPVLASDVKESAKIDLVEAVNPELGIVQDKAYRFDAGDPTAIQTVLQSLANSKVNDLTPSITFANRQMDRTFKFEFLSSENNQLKFKITPAYLTRNDDGIATGQTKNEPFEITFDPTGDLVKQMEEIDGMVQPKNPNIRIVNAVEDQVTQGSSDITKDILSATMDYKYTRGNAELDRFNREINRIKISEKDFEEKQDLELDAIDEHDLLNAGNPPIMNHVAITDEVKNNISTIRNYKQFMATTIGKDPIVVSDHISHTIDDAIYAATKRLGSYTKTVEDENGEKHDVAFPNYQIVESPNQVSIYAQREPTAEEQERINKITSDIQNGKVVSSKDEKQLEAYVATDSSKIRNENMAIHFATPSAEDIENGLDAQIISTLYELDGPMKNALDAAENVFAQETADIQQAYAIKAEQHQMPTAQGSDGRDAFYEAYLLTHSELKSQGDRPNKRESFEIEFTMRNGERAIAGISYDPNKREAIRDANGNPVYDEYGLLAKKGAWTFTVNYPKSMGGGTVEIPMRVDMNNIKDPREFYNAKEFADMMNALEPIYQNADKNIRLFMTHNGWEYSIAADDKLNELATENSSIYPRQVNESYREMMGITSSLRDYNETSKITKLEKIAIKTQRKTRNNKDIINAKKAISKSIYAEKKAEEQSAVQVPESWKKDFEKVFDLNSFGFKEDAFKDMTQAVITMQEMEKKFNEITDETQKAAALVTLGQFREKAANQLSLSVYEMAAIEVAAEIRQQGKNEQSLSHSTIMQSPPRWLVKQAKKINDKIAHKINGAKQTYSQIKDKLNRPRVRQIAAEVYDARMNRNKTERDAIEYLKNGFTASFNQISKQVRMSKDKSDKYAQAQNQTYNNYMNSAKAIAAYVDHGEMRKDIDKGMTKDELIEKFCVLQETSERLSQNTYAATYGEMTQNIASADRAQLKKDMEALYDKQFKGIDSTDEKLLANEKAKTEIESKKETQKDSMDR